MTLEQQLDRLVVESFYEDVLKGPSGLVAQASARLSAGAPNIRDIPATTYAFLSDKSDDNTAVIVFLSDSQAPDVLKVTGSRQRQIGRPQGSRNGVRNQTVEYNNGIDMANVTNGRIRTSSNGFPTQLRTGRAKPMPTEGWWIAALKSAVAVFGR